MGGSRSVAVPDNIPYSAQNINQDSFALFNLNYQMETRFDIDR